MSNKEKLIDETVSKLLDLYLRGSKGDVGVVDFAHQFMNISKPMIDKYNEELMF